MRALYLAAVTVGLPLAVGIALALNLLHALTTSWLPASPERKDSAPDA